MTTIGALIESLYTKYERELEHPDLAAAATHRAIEKILRSRRRAG
jgi:hypothetical protein